MEGGERGEEYPTTLARPTTPPLPLPFHFTLQPRFRLRRPHPRSFTRLIPLN